MKTNRIQIALAVVLLLALASFFIYTGKSQLPAQSSPQETPQAGTVSLSVQGLYTGKQVYMYTGDTLLQLLQTVNAQDSELQLSTKIYAGLGVLVESMHGVKNGTDKKYWQYKVGGVMPQVGADVYKLKNGDSVEWFFATSQE